MKLKIDGYGRKRSDNTVLSSIGSFICRLDLLNNDNSYTYLNRKYYTAADWGKYIIEDEDELNAVCDMFEERADADMDEE